MSADAATVTVTTAICPGYRQKKIQMGLHMTDICRFGLSHQLRKFFGHGSLLTFTFFEGSSGLIAFTKISGVFEP